MSNLLVNAKNIIYIDCHMHADFPMPIRLLKIYIIIKVLIEQKNHILPVWSSKLPGCHLCCLINWKMFKKKLNLLWLVDFVLIVVRDINKPVTHVVARCIGVLAYCTVSTKNFVSVFVKFIPPLG